VELGAEVVDAAEGGSSGTGWLCHGMELGEVIVVWHPIFGTRCGKRLSAKVVARTDRRPAPSAVSYSHQVTEAVSIECIAQQCNVVQEAGSS